MLPPNRPGTDQTTPERTTIDKDTNLQTTNLEDWQKEILNNILAKGTAIRTDKDIIAGENKGLSHVLNLSSGSPRLHRNVINRFVLILSQPSTLIGMNSFELRCCLCKKVVNYPCWYYEVKYAISHFHYFICFDSSDSSKPTTKCYRKG